MRRLIVAAGAALLLSCVMALPASALGPVDGEIGALWWANEYDVDGASAVDGDAPGFRAEVWMMKKYGVRAARFSSDLDDIGLDSSDYSSLDLMWKAFSPTENNFLALGLGWEEMDMTGIGLDGDTSGVRLSVEGRVGIIGAVYAYGQGSYLPSLDDATSAGATLKDLEGFEYELGVSWKAAPFISFRAGYRENSLDYSSAGIDGTAETRGFLLGTGFHF